MSYQEFKNNVLNPANQRLGDGQCVAAIDGNDRAYVAHLYPGVNWTSVFAPVNGAREMAGKSNQYVTWVPNDVNNANQLPSQGDVMVFDKTPIAGYTNNYDNPYGHVGICDSADNNGYTLLHQNSPSNGAPMNLSRFAWKFRKCLGWYKMQGISQPAPSPSPSGRTILHLNKYTDTTFYRMNGTTFTIHAVDDSYDYKILQDLGNKVKVNSASGGGDGYIYLTYTGSGAPIPGRYVR